MSKALRAYKILTNALFVICAVIFTYFIVDVASAILADPSNGLGVIGLLAIFIYAIPVSIYLVIYSVIMLVKKRYIWYDLVIGLLYLISYASLILVPILIA